MGEVIGKNMGEGTGPTGSLEMELKKVLRTWAALPWHHCWNK
jgi:hypothetical protein